MKKYIISLGLMILISGVLFLDWKNNSDSKEKHSYKAKSESIYNTPNKKKLGVSLSKNDTQNSGNVEDEFVVSLEPSVSSQQVAELEKDLAPQDAEESKTNIVAQIEEPDNPVMDLPVNYDPVKERKEQEKIFAELKEEIKYYDYNERFDLKGFLESDRLHRLDSDLGSQLIDYVFERLQGISLMQAQADSADLLIEHQE